MGAAQVGRGKDDAVNKVFGVTWSWDCEPNRHVQLFISMSTDEKNTKGAENDMILLYKSTHRPQMLETEEETCESEKAQKKKMYITILIISPHILHVSLISFKFNKTFTAVSHLLLAHKHLVKDACLPACLPACRCRINLVCCHGSSE